MVGPVFSRVKVFEGLVPERPAMTIGEPIPNDAVLVASISPSRATTQCRVTAFALACARKNRIISRLASGPRASV
jgi:hypothetical protein